MSNPTLNTDLVIVGAGAAGLLAAVSAGELGMNCVVVERRHRVGLKLLMCGNNRCNISHALSTEQMIEAYGDPVAEFIAPALNAFSPQALRSWFAKNGLATCVKNDRVYPTTENGDDVLHCFTDKLRDLTVPLMLNCPVQRISPLLDGGYEVLCEKLSIRSKCVLLATGGVSYPKTGSVGDGQRMLSELGVQVTPLRPGLAGVDVLDKWLAINGKCELLNVEVTVSDDNHGTVAVTNGNLLCEKGCLRGTAIFDATRIIARNQLEDFKLTLDLFPKYSQKILQEKLSNGGIDALNIPQPFIPELKRLLPTQNPANWLKHIPLNVDSIRPIKEAIVTVGGVALSEIDSQTLELRKLPGLFVAGELMDVDGPTGGFNLHAAFATARLAIHAIAKSLGINVNATQRKTDDDRPGQQRGDPQQRYDQRPPRRNQRDEYPRESRRQQYGDDTRHHKYGQRDDYSRQEQRDGNLRQEWRDKHNPADRPTASSQKKQRSFCDTKPGNRWDNSEFDKKRSYNPKNSQNGGRKSP